MKYLFETPVSFLLSFSVKTAQCTVLKSADRTFYTFCKERFMSERPPRAIFLVNAFLDFNTVPLKSINLKTLYLWSSHLTLNRYFIKNNVL